MCRAPGVGTAFFHGLAKNGLGVEQFLSHPGIFRAFGRKQENYLWNIFHSLPCRRSTKNVVRRASHIGRAVWKMHSSRVGGVTDVGEAFPGTGDFPAIFGLQRVQRRFRSSRER